MNVSSSHLMKRAFGGWKIIYLVINVHQNAIYYKFIPPEAVTVG